jgi:fused signal recognition particle receptor
MGFFRKKKDPRVEEISAWAAAYLEEREKGNGAAEQLMEEAEGVEEAAVAAVQDSAVEQKESEPPATLVAESDRTDAEVQVAASKEQVVQAPHETEVEPAEPDVTEGFVEALEEAEVALPPTLLQRLRTGLAKSRDGFVGRIDRLLANRTKIDGETLEALEQILIESDIGVQHSLELIETIQARVEKKDLQDPAAIKAYIREELTSVLSNREHHLQRPAEGPFIILVVGVNGVGKTTTIGKLARRFVKDGDSVLLAAGDTFRAAASEQLEIWGERVGAQVIKHQSGADPSAVVFDALKAASSREKSVVIADTAGRLHTKVNLMEELKKMKRVMAKVVPEAPHEILLVLDATTGQNALSQAKIFHEAVGVTGIALTKLDGTAKGGIITAIVGELGIPVKLIGIGEGIEDLRDFDPHVFVQALFDA